MDVLKAQLQGNKQELLVNIVKVEAVITFALVICSFVVAATANAGFNCVLTAFLNVAFIGGSYYVLKNSKAPIAVRSSCDSVEGFLLRYLSFVV